MIFMSFIYSGNTRNIVDDFGYYLGIFVCVCFHLFALWVDFTAFKNNPFSVFDLFVLFVVELYSCV